MGFIDRDKPNTAMISGFTILCLISVVTTAIAAYFGATRNHYRSHWSIQFFFPIFVCFMSSVENFMMAIFHEDPIQGEEPFKNAFFTIFYILHAMMAPSMLLTTFDLCYLVHKRRSVKFCCISFDNRGHRIANNAISCMWRNAIRALSTVLCATGIAVNLGLLTRINSSYTDDEAGTIGWAELLGNGIENANRPQVFYDLLPWGVVSICNLYLTFTLWRYGSFSAMVVHDFYINPWIWPLVGTSCILICFSVKMHSISSNAGIVIMMISILFLMREVDKEILAQEEFSNFLKSVSNVGNAIHTPSLPPTKLSIERLDEENGEALTSPSQSDERQQ